MNTAARKLLAEFVGTFLLVFLAVGAAIFGIAAKVGADGNGPGNGVVGVALAFGLVLLGIAYAFGPISGAHVNPAVTLGMLLGRRMPTNEAVGYWIAQFLGAIAAGAVLKLFVSSFGVTDYTGCAGHERLRQRRHQHGRRLRPRGPAHRRLRPGDPAGDRAGRRPRLRRHRDRPDPDPRAPRRHPADRHLGQPRPLVRAGPVRRRRRARPGLAVHPRPAGRRGHRRRSSGS